MRTSLRIILMFVNLLYSGGEALAQSPTPRCPKQLVVSGGVSLGAYQAGWLYAYGVYRRKHCQSPYEVVTGASAGATNAVLAALDASGSGGALGNHFSPQDFWTHPLWELWVDGLDWGAMTKVDAGSNYLLDQDPVLTFAQGLGSQLSTATWNPNFVTKIGVTVTNTTPRSVKALGLTFVRASEKVGLELTGSSSGFAARQIKVYNDPHLDYYLTRGGTGSIPFGATSSTDTSVARILVASGAFPFAFEPQQFDVYNQNGTKRTDFLIDGGILNNNPLQLALDLAGTPTPNFSDILYLDVDSISYQPKLKPTSSSKSLLDVLESLGLSVFLGGHEGHLNEAAERNPSITTVWNPERRHPLAGEHFFALAGFFAWEFRAHDFMRGMDDAAYQLGMQPTDFSKSTATCLLDFQKGSPGACPIRHVAGSWAAVKQIATVTEALSNTCQTPPASGGTASTRCYWELTASEKWSQFVERLDDLGLELNSGLLQDRAPEHYPQFIRQSLEERVEQALSKVNWGRSKTWAIRRAANAGLDHQFGVVRPRFQTGVRARASSLYGSLEVAVKANTFRKLNSGFHLAWELYGLVRPWPDITTAGLGAGIEVGCTLMTGIDATLSASLANIDLPSVRADRDESFVIPIEARATFVKQIQIGIGMILQPQEPNDHGLSLSLGFWPCDCD